MMGQAGLRLRCTESYAWCERLTRREAGNFYLAFRILPREQQRAMCALYAFMRITDDIADADGLAETKQTQLALWREQLHAAQEGQTSHPLHPALAHTLRNYAVPVRYLDEVIDGVTMDLDVVRYKKFDDLYRYCYHVASAVGLASIHIWGFRNEEALPMAESAGIAFQLTNILRDLAEDFARGRIYLPGEDLERFGYHEPELQQQIQNTPFRQLMEFEANRARDFYHRGEQLMGQLDPAGRAVFQVMLQTYRGLLERIVQLDYDVFTQRVRLSKWHKLWLACRALPVRYGWLPG